jgi:hypothetical protein
VLAEVDGGMLPNTWNADTQVSCVISLYDQRRLGFLTHKKMYAFYTHSTTYKKQGALDQSLTQ